MSFASRGTSSTTRTLTQRTLAGSRAQSRAGELYLDSEPTVRAGVELERATVRGGDRGDNRQAEPDAVD